MNRNEAEARLIARAQNDPTFRRTLIADPTATVAREFKVEFPQGVRVRILEETAREMYLVLPVPPADTPLEDSELDAISGGRMQERDRRFLSFAYSKIG